MPDPWGEDTDFEDESGELEGTSAGTTGDPTGTGTSSGASDPTDPTGGTGPTSPGLGGVGPSGSPTGGGGSSGGSKDDEEDTTYVSGRATGEVVDPEEAGDLGLTLFDSYEWIASTDDTDYDLLLSASVTNANTIQSAINQPLDPVSASCMVEETIESEEAAEEVVEGGTHYLYLEGDNTDVYSGYRLGTSGTKIGTLTNSTKVYLYPEHEFLGTEGEWSKIKPLQGELAETDCYIQRAHLLPLSGTAQSLNIVSSPPLEPKGFVPDWRNRGACDPFFNPRTAKYCATVSTQYTTLSETESLIKTESIKPGIVQLLEYYSRLPNGHNNFEDAAEFLLENSYYFAEVEQVYLSPSPNSTAKALVTVPARYFDAIPKYSSAPVIPKNGIRSVLLNTHTVDSDFDLIAKTIKEVDSKLSTFSGTIVGFKPVRESLKLGKVLPAIKELIRVNGHEFRSDHEDMIEVSVDNEFKPLQVVLYVDGLGHKLDIGFNAFKVSAGINLPRTMHYVLQSHNMLSYIRMQKFKTTPFDWLTFCTLHTYPALEVRFTSVLTPGINTKQLQAQAMDMKNKFDSVPFKDLNQLKFEAGQLNDPKFLMNMTLARANVSLPSGDNILLNLPDLLDEVGSLNDLFGKFLGKVEIPKLIQMAMNSVMENMSFPDLFEAMLSVILKQLSIEMIVEQIVSKLDVNVQTDIFSELMEGLDLPSECYCAIFDKIDLSMEALQTILPEGTITISTETDDTTTATTTEGIVYDDSDPCDVSVEEIVNSQATKTISGSSTCSSVVDVDPNILIEALVTMAISGVAEVTFEAANLEKHIGDGQTETLQGEPSKYPEISPTKIKKAMFEIIEECSGFDVAEIIELLSGSIKDQISGGSLEIDTLKELPIISTSFDTLMADSSLNLNMEIPQLGGLSLEMPSVNMSLGSIDMPSMKIPTITLPEVPTFDLMGTVFEGIETGIKQAITDALIEMAKTVIEGLLGDFESGLGDLSFGEANINDLLASSLGSIGSASETVSVTFEPLGISADGSTSFTDAELEASLASCGISNPSGEQGTPEDFLDDISEALSIGELENLLNGNPSANTCSLVSQMVQSGYNNMAPAFDDCSKIAEVFSEIGESVDPNLIQSLKPKKARIANKLEYLCKEAQPFDEEPYKDVMRAKGLTDEQIEDQLEQEKDRQKQALEDLANLLAEVQADSVLSEVVPPIYPEDCDSPSLLPADSDIPEMNMVNEMVVDSVLAGTKTAWKTETDIYFETLLSGSENGTITPLIYDGPEATKAAINPMFMSLYSAGYPLCNSEGTVYTNADDLAACKIIIESKNPARNPLKSLENAFDAAEENDDNSEYYGAFEDWEDTKSSWFSSDANISDTTGSPSWDAATTEEKFDWIWSKTNILQSELSQSVTKDVREVYNYSNIEPVIEMNWNTDGDNTVSSDFKYSLVSDDVTTTITIPYVTGSTSASNTKSGATVDVTTDAVCVSQMDSCMASPTASIELTVDFEQGAPKPFQAYSQILYSALGSPSTDETNLFSTNSDSDVNTAIGVAASFIVRSEIEQYGEKFAQLASEVSSSLTKDLLLGMKIEASEKEGCDPTFVLNPSDAKSAAMDAINSKCPKPPVPGERSPTADGTLVGLIELTLRAYIADIMLRSGPLLTKLPVTKPSEILKSYIYNDMVFDMGNISSQYYADFFTEAVNMYNNRENAISELTDYQVFSILIEEQFAKVVPALARNLGAEYSDLHVWNCNALIDGPIYKESGEHVSEMELGMYIDTSVEGTITVYQKLDDDDGFTDEVAVAEYTEASASLDALIQGLIATDEYQTIFNYCIPINDLASLAHLHVGKQITINSPTVQTAFDGTKEELKLAFDVLVYGPEAGLSHSVGPSNEQSFTDANNNVGTQVEAFSDNTNMAKIMTKMVINTVPTMIKGLAEQLDPNIAVTKLIRNKALEKGVPMHPIAASMSILPMNIIPPIFGGIGMPVGPLGFAYWALAKPDKIEKRVLEQAGNSGESSSVTPDDTSIEVDNSECNPSED